MKPGRPTKYKPEYCDKAIELGKRGKSFTYIAAELDIHKDTLYEWIKNYPDFSDAMTKSRYHSQKWWEDMGQENLKAKTFQSAIYNKQMACRFPDDYAERHHVTSDNKTDLTTGGEKLNSYDIEDLKRFIAEKEESHVTDL